MVAFAGAVIAGPDATFVLGSVIVLYAFARSGPERAAAILLPCAARLALAAGLFHFEPPEQVIDLATRDVTPLGLIIQNDIWWPRYLFSYPPIAAMDHWGLRFEYSFALYGAATIPLEIAALYRSGVALKPRLGAGVVGRVVIVLMLTALVFGLATKMNGRLIVAHLGMAIILGAQTTAAARRRFRADTWILTVLGLAMGQMTTGTGVVAYAQVVCGSLVAASAARHQMRSVVAGLALLSGIAGPFLYRGVEKNFTFFGGDFSALSGLLYHGAGGFLLDRPLLLLFLVAGASAGAAIAWRARSTIRATVHAVYLPTLVAIPLALAGGLFGYSTLTMVFPPMFVCAAVAAATLVERQRAPQAQPKTS